MNFPHERQLSISWKYRSSRLGRPTFPVRTLPLLFGKCPKFRTFYTAFYSINWYFKAKLILLLFILSSIFTVPVIPDKKFKKRLGSSNKNEREKKTESFTKQSFSQFWSVYLLLILPWCVIPERRTSGRYSVQPNSHQPGPGWGRGRLVSRDAVSLAAGYAPSLASGLTRYRSPSWSAAQERIFLEVDMSKL